MQKGFAMISNAWELLLLPAPFLATIENLVIQLTGAFKEVFFVFILFALDFHSFNLDKMSLAKKKKMERFASDQPWPFFRYLPLGDFLVLRFRNKNFAASFRQLLVASVSMLALMPSLLADVVVLSSREVELVSLVEACCCCKKNKRMEMLRIKIK